MANFLEAQKKAKSLTPKKITTDLFNFIKTIENEVFDLNVRQLENAENSLGEPLINKNKKFSGVYTEMTEQISLLENPLLPKKAGELYNFVYYGDFIKGFQMKLFNDHVEVFNTGIGSGEKKVFFDGYSSLYGLTSESIIVIIESRIKPFLIKYFRKNLT